MVSPKGKRYLRVFKPGESLHTHDGCISLDDLQEMDFGMSINTHLGKKYLVLKPTIYDLLKSVKRQTQIIYPKEIGYALLKLGIGPGSRVMEAGSGSGSLTLALAWYVGEQGQVHSFERRAEFYALCRKNLERVGLEHRVKQYHQDIADGLDLKNIEAAFIDVRTPWDYLPQIAQVLANGAPIGFLLPTTNQVGRLLQALEQGPFAQPEVVEILVRHYKPVPERLRPEDRMVAHTGFLVFARLQQG